MTKSRRKKQQEQTQHAYRQYCKRMAQKPSRRTLHKLQALEKKLAKHPMARTIQQASRKLPLVFNPNYQNVTFVNRYISIEEEQS